MTDGPIPSQRADVSIVSAIRRLAETPDAVRMTERAEYDTMGRVTKADICAAICQWIDEGEAVQVLVTQYAAGHVGKPAYVMKPTIGSTGYYVKVVIRDSESANELLLIVSAHPH